MMKTKIINLGGVVFEGEAKAVNAHTQSGEITILKHHQPILSTLAPESRIHIDTNEGSQEFATTSGFIHFDANNVLTILIQ